LKPPLTLGGERGLVCPSPSPARPQQGSLVTRDRQEWPLGDPCPQTACQSQKKPPIKVAGKVLSPAYSWLRAPSGLSPNIGADLLRDLCSHISHRPGQKKVTQPQGFAGVWEQPTQANTHSKFSSYET